MKEKTRATIIATATPYLESGETVRAAARAVEGPAWAVFFGAIGMLAFMQQRLLVVTDRNVYLMNADRMVGNKAKGVVAKHPRGTVAVKHEAGKMFDHVRVGDTDLKVGKLFKKDAAEAVRLAG